MFLIAGIVNGQVLTRVTLSNNYIRTETPGVFQSLDNPYLCSLTQPGYFNVAYHNGSSNEPTIGDYIVYNDRYTIPHEFSPDSEQGYAIVKMRDFDKLIEMKKSNGQIVSVYSCTSSAVISIPPPAIAFENGTCKCPTATVGDTEVINGITYTVVDNTTIVTQIAANNINLCTTQVTEMSQLFEFNATFNSDIGFWDTSNVTNMSSMFSGASVFNQDISGWDISSVTTMYNMFNSAIAFNQDIGRWDISNTISINRMFQNATVFNQDLSGWDVLNVTNCTGVFDDTGAWTLAKPNFTNCIP